MKIRVSTRTNIKPLKVYIKGIKNWPGKSVGLVLSKDQALLFAEGLIKASRSTNRVDVTIFPKAKNPVITITYVN